MPDIAINDVTPRIQYTATGGQTVFPYPFAVFAQTDLKVYLTPAGSESDDTADLLVLTTEYTVSGVGAEAGGNVTLVTGATLNDVITIERDMPIERSTDFQLAGDFLAATLNNELDRVAMMIQQIETIFERRGLSFARSVDLQGVSLLLPKPSGSKVLAMNAAATELVWADIVALGVVATAFAQTLLDDVDAPTALATLGAAASGANTDITSLSAPALGAATATTAADTDNSTKVATTAAVRAILAAAPTGNYQIFTAGTSNFTAEQAGDYLVFAIGGGGGGSGGANAGNNANQVGTSGHGGAGGNLSITKHTLTDAQVVSVTVGAGGAGGAAGIIGADGSNTTFGALATATGGKGGQASGGNYVAAGGYLTASGGTGGGYGGGRGGAGVGYAAPTAGNVGTAGAAPGAGGGGGSGAGSNGGGAATGGAGGAGADGLLVVLW